MRRFGILASALGAVALAACQTTGGPKVDAATAFSRLPIWCPIRAELPEPMARIDDVAGPDFPAGTRWIGVISEGENSVYRVGCACNDQWDFALMSQGDGERLASKMAGAIKGDNSSFRYEDKGAVKIINVEAARKTFEHNHVTKSRFVFEGKCLQALNAWAPPAKYALVDRFISSGYDVRYPRSAHSVTAPVSAAPTIEQRLQELKSLYDRKLITKDVYEEQQRGALGGK